jgi:predicted NUDIX family NTP pyrophosphohydrolase
MESCYFFGQPVTNRFPAVSRVDYFSFASTQCSISNGVRSAKKKLQRGTISFEDV